MVTGYDVNTTLHRCKRAELDCTLLDCNGRPSVAIDIAITARARGSQHDVVHVLRLHGDPADAEQIIRDLRAALDDLPVSDKPITEEAT